LRDYGVAGQIGLEPTIDQYVANMVEVFREVRRVLRKDGTLWLNLGDAFAAAKQQLGIPWRIAFALQADGWILRSDIIWHKPNPMPESVRDRPTKAHEYVFLFAKSPRYYYDAEAIKEVAIYTGDNRGARRDSRRGRSVWTVPVGRFKGAHFATFPEKLVTPCILAGTSAAGCCPDCFAPWRRIVERMRVATRPGTNAVKTPDPGRHVTEVRTVGWEPSCECEPVPAIVATVLDPFAGVATTGVVALRHGRRFVGIELNPEYVAMGRARLETVQRDLSVS
jgi:DNA modification methylase